MRELIVDLEDRSYPIAIGRGLLQQSGSLDDYIAGNQAMLITNTVVAQWYLEPALKLLRAVQPDYIVLEDGEAHKNLATVEHIITHLLKKKHNRTTTLIALGGGVTGDIAGFAASIYQRGVRFLQIPTTLLAQVDSSVGGKTGVNHPLGKNMIGAFHQPRKVIIDTDVLTTLPAREFSAGMAEVIKYGLIYDANFFDWIERHLDGLIAQDAKLLETVIYRSCEIKARVVSEDEKESGIRAILNLGHTFGHAIETGLGYGNWLHGEAVGMGMLLACRLSHLMGWLDASYVERLHRLLVRLSLPTELPAALTPETMRNLMALDKKVDSGKLRLVLLKGCGQAVISADFDKQMLERVILSGYE